MLQGRNTRIFAESFGSIIIKRTNGSKEKRSISPGSPRIPPSPGRKLKNRVEAVNRSSQIVVKKKKTGEGEIKDY